MKNRLLQSLSGRGLAIIVGSALFSSLLPAAEVILLQESFETDGAGTRYTVQNASDDGEGDYFARRELRSAGTNSDRGSMDGDFFWGARDIDGDGTAVDDLLATQGRVIFNEFSIAGVGNLVLKASATQGTDGQEWNNAMYFEYSIDGGPWFSPGGFRGTFTNSPARYYEGDTETYPSEDNPRLSRKFKDFEWRIFGSGSTMVVRVFADLNGGNEEYALDNVRVIGDDAVGTMSISTDMETYVETDGSGTLSFSLDLPAPAGGLPVSFEFNAGAETEVSIPPVLIPEGATSHSVTFDILADNRFDGDELVIIRASAEGYSRDAINIMVNNVDAEPSLVVNEMYGNPRGDNAENEFAGNANGDDIFVHTQEEFMEMVNTGGSDLDLSGWIIRDGTSPRHFFPEGTVLAPGQAIVVFGGGDPTGIFGGALVQTATTGNLGMTDEGDTMSITAGTGIAVQATYEPDVGVSGHTATRNPDITGPFVDITTVPEAGGVFFSPGTKVDGTPFLDFSNSIELSLNTAEVSESAGATAVTASVALAQNASADVTVTIGVEGANADEVSLETATISILSGSNSGSVSFGPVNDGILDGDRQVRLIATAPGMLLGRARLTVMEANANPYAGLVINEAMPSILDLGADPNGNGEFDELVDDQYIEIVNGTGETVSLAGWKLYGFNLENQTGRSLVHEFPSGSGIAPNGSILVFGGGDQADLDAASAALFGGAVAQAANRGGNGVNLPDDGDGVIELFTPDGFLVDGVEYVEENANQIMAVTRNPDITGDFGALHLEASGTGVDFSPGANVDGVPFSGNGAVALPFWAEWALDQNGYSNTESFLGWIFVDEPYIFVYSISGWVYMPESSVSSSGAWGYFPK